jgi:AraC-like DNA-binding protein
MNFLHFDLLDTRDQPRPGNAPLPPERIEPPDSQLAEVTTRRIVELCFGFNNMGFQRSPFDPVPVGISTVLLTGLLMELDAVSDPANLWHKQNVTPYYDRLIRQVALRITENPQGTPSVAKLAAEFGYSPDHFARIFKNVTGQTPELYAVQARLQRAQRLLRETTLAVGEVADRLGYCNIYFFSRQFKQFTHLSPLQYRRKHAPP